jgi:hypothetical protein
VHDAPELAAARNCVMRPRRRSWRSNFVRDGLEVGDLSSCGRPIICKAFSTGHGLRATQVGVARRGRREDDRQRVCLSVAGAG